MTPRGKKTHKPHLAYNNNNVNNITADPGRPQECIHKKIWKICGSGCGQNVVCWEANFFEIHCGGVRGTLYVLVLLTTALSFVVSVFEITTVLT